MYSLWHLYSCLDRTDLGPCSMFFEFNLNDVVVEILTLVKEFVSCTVAGKMHNFLKA